MVEGSQRGTTQESISIEKQTVGTFQTCHEVTSGDAGKGKGARPHIKGRFHGGAVVLATSTEIDEEDGSRKPRKVVWITHAGTLIKCAPEHLRYSSERARQLANMEQAQRLPWTHEGLDGWLQKGQYESLPITDTPDDHDTDEDEEGVKDDSSAAWEQETRQVNRENWKCSRVLRLVLHVRGLKQRCHRLVKTLHGKPGNRCEKCPKHQPRPKNKNHEQFS